MKVFHIPIEPYKTRYTADWIQQFEGEFEAHNLEYETILGETFSDTVTEGGVLDACGTHAYKFSQLQKLITKINANEVKNGDIIFFADLWFPGLESLFYIRNMLGIDFKIYGIFHAGTYDAHDFTYRNGMREWGKWLEACWFEQIDKIFVATKFHKELILKNSFLVPGLADRIRVTGIPFYGDALATLYGGVEKENIIVFPHRLDIEKHPEKFDLLVDRLRSEGLEFRAVKTIVETSSRDEYFNLLARSKVMVSFAEQETFGYSTLESMALGNVVIVPNKLSYKETVPDGKRYDTEEECYQMVKYALLNYHKPEYHYEKWANAVDNMIKLF